MGQFPWPAKGWPNRGDLVKFLNENGYTYDLVSAREHFIKGALLTIQTVEIGDWSTSYEFKELPGHWFNSVMFAWPAKIDRTDWVPTYENRFEIDPAELRMSAPSSDVNRQPGYYWVKDALGWTVAEWKNDEWRFITDEITSTDNDLLHIQLLPIPEPK
jgi:hypothetical protein